MGLALVVSLLVFPKTLRFARQHDIVDNPNARKLQRVPVPVLGGVAVYTGIMTGAVLLLIFDQNPLLMWTLMGMTVMQVIGTWDDMEDISSVLRFLIEVALVGAFIVLTGVYMDDLHGLWGVNAIPPEIGIPLSIASGVGIINATNLIDGVDGYASGFGMVASVLFALAFWSVWDHSMVTMAMIVAGALLPFFMHNVFGVRSKMFMGDGGTLMLGVLMTVFVLYTQSSQTPCDELADRGVSLTAMALAMLCILAPFTDMLEAVAALLIPERKVTVEEDPTLRLEERFLGHPALAIAQSRIAIDAMAQQSRSALEASFALMEQYSQAGFEQVEAMESTVDKYEDRLGSYLVKLTASDLNDQQSREASKFLHTLSDFERISDHALNIAESAREMHEKQLSFSPEAKKELSVTIRAVSQVMSMAVSAFTLEDLDAARQVEPLEEVIDNLCDELKLRHVERLQQGNCTISQGFVFNDLLTNLERISDHCSNIAVALIELDAGTFDTHAYLDDVLDKHSPDFMRYYEGFRAQFAL